MRIEDIRPAEGSTKNRKRVGRGFGSGHGKTSCKGHKGQKARSGGTKGAGFEGGQMPLQRRVPKRGFTNIFKKEYAIVNLDTIDAMKDETVITPELLIEKGVIRKMKDGLKVLASGSIKRSVTIKANAFSASASAKIEAAGGKTEVL